MKKAKLSPAELTNIHYKLQNGEGIQLIYVLIIIFNLNSDKNSNIGSLTLGKVYSFYLC